MFLKSMTMKKNQCIIVHNNADSWLQFAANSEYCCSELCPYHVPLCSTLKKARFALQGHAHPRVPCLAGADYRWSNDLRSFDLCTTLIKLLCYSFLSCLPEINEYSKVSVKLVWEKLETNQLCFQPTSKSEVVFILPSATQNLVDMAPTVSLKLSF